MKYKLEIYGWSFEAMGHSITDKQVKSIQNLMKIIGFNELWEVRNDLEEEGIIDDLYNPDLFHKSRGLSNDALWFVVSDENNKEVLNFTVKDIGDFYDTLGNAADDVPYERYLAIPGLGESSEIDNILSIFDESKGGITDFEPFASEIVPKPCDFCYQNGEIGTPNFEWEYVSKVYFKGKELKVNNWLDSSGKASTFEIYKKNGSIIC